MISKSFLVCVLGIYASFLTWGILQERVSSTPYHSSGQSGSSGRRYYRYFIVLNLAQSLMASLVAIVYSYVRGINLHLRMSGRELRQYMLVGFFNCIGSPFGYASLKHIDYPTMILGKSCKLVPVMLTSVLFYGQRYPLTKYASVALITVGVSLFMLLHDNEQAESHKRANSVYGLVLLSINLVIDGVTNSSQDRIFKEHKSVSGMQMMVMMNLCSSLYMALYLLAYPFSTELRDSLLFMHQFPTVVNDIALFSLCGGLGQIFIFYTLEKFGSMSLVAVNVTRKLFTILLSVVWFGHHLTVSQYLAVALVFSGIILETASPKTRKVKKS